MQASTAPMFVVDSPYEVARWRPLVQWVLFIPHLVIQNALRSLACVVFLVYWVFFVFTGRLNRSLYDVLAMHERYAQRSDSFLLGFSESYPPFDFNLGGADNAAYPPVRVTLPEPPEAAPRRAAFNFLLAIPHYFVFLLYAVASVAVALVGWFAVLFTGHWPKGMRDFLVKVTNYYLRIWAYVTMATNAYPTFGLA